MRFSKDVKFKNLKPHIADAIKESCYRTDARFYNIANEVHNIVTFSLEPGVEIAEGLSKIIDKTIRESVALGCDLSIIVKGILIGTFRSTPSIAQEAHKTIRILITEILQSVFKYKGNLKETIDGILSAIIVAAHESKLNTQEAVVIVREDILSSAKEISPEFGDNVKEALHASNNSL